MVSPAGIVAGDAETVGVRYFAGKKGVHPPLRIYYPAKHGATTTPPRRHWFDNHAGFAFFLVGYLHVVGIKHGTLWHRAFTPVFHALASILTGISTLASDTSGFCLHTPAGLLLPDAPPATTKKLPLVVFSHGLSGTGQENLLLLAAWARAGFCVVAVHHTDGSSCRVVVDNNNNNNEEELYYQHGPQFANYDPTFRPKQIERRVKEMKQAVDFLAEQIVVNNDDDICCDTTSVIAAGYSYGAATAALTIHTYPQMVQGLILLDGWFYIDVAKSAGIEFEFPSQVFGPDDDDTIIKPVPSVFINSQQFAQYPKLYSATRKLAHRLNKSSQADNMHVLEGTNHNNFNDLVFWFPLLLMQGLKIIGPGDPQKVYQDIVRISTDFLKSNFQ